MLILSANSEIQVFGAKGSDLNPNRAESYQQWININFIPARLTALDIIDSTPHLGNLCYMFFFFSLKKGKSEKILFPFVILPCPLRLST